MNTKDMIFVFGSNTGGIHGAGAAKAALVEHGAVWGQGVGLQGRSYAIPTKSHETVTTKWGRSSRVGRTLPLWRIEEYVEEFIQFAKEHLELNFQVTRIGCGLAGLKDSQIAPMFLKAPDNCWFDEYWRGWYGEPRKFWGTF